MMNGWAASSRANGGLPRIGAPGSGAWSMGLARRPTLGQTFDEIIGVSPAVGHLLRLAAHGATSYLGFWIGSTERGFFSALGWAVGILQGTGALVDVLGLAEELQKAVSRAQGPASFDAFEEPP